MVNFDRHSTVGMAERGSSYEKKCLFTGEQPAAAAPPRVKILIDLFSKIESIFMLLQGGNSTFIHSALFPPISETQIKKTRIPFAQNAGAY